MALYRKKSPWTYVYLLLSFDARVYNSVEQSRQQVSAYDGHCQQHRRGLDDGIITVLRRRQRRLGNPRDIEDILKEECSCDQQANRETKDRYQRNERVAQGMAIDDDCSRMPLARAVRT